MQIQNFLPVLSLSLGFPLSFICQLALSLSIESLCLSLPSPANVIVNLLRLPQILMICNLHCIRYTIDQYERIPRGVQGGPVRQENENITARCPHQRPRPRTAYVWSVAGIFYLFIFRPILSKKKVGGKNKTFLSFILKKDSVCDDTIIIFIHRNKKTTTAPQNTSRPPSSLRCC